MSVSGFARYELYRNLDWLRSATGIALLTTFVAFTSDFYPPFGAGLLAKTLLVFFLPGIVLLSIFCRFYKLRTRIFFAVPISFLISSVVSYITALSPIGYSETPIIIINGVISILGFALLEHYYNERIYDQNISTDNRKYKQQIIIMSFILTLVVTRYSPVFGVGGRLYGRMWGYNYNYPANHLAETGSFPNLGSGPMILEGMRHNLNSDYLQHAAIAMFQVIYGGYEAFPYPTFVIVAVLLGISTRYFSTITPGLLAVLGFLSFPLVHSSNMYFNAVTLTTGLYLFIVVLSADILHHDRTENFVLVVLIAIIMMRFYHSAAFYFAAFLGVIFVLCLVSNYLTTGPQLARPQLLAAFGVLFGIYVITISSRLGNLLTVGLASVPQLYGKISDLIFINDKSITQMQEYQYSNPQSFYLTALLFIGFIGVLVGFGLWKERNYLQQKPEYIVYLFCGICMMIALVPLLLIHGLVNRTVITFGVPLAITGLMLYGLPSDQSRLVPIFIAFLVLTVGMYGIGVMNETPSQNYVIYHESQVEGTDWSVRYATDNLVMSDVKTVSLLTNFGRTTTTPITDAKLLTPKPTDTLQLLYHQPSNVAEYASQERGVQYIIFTQDMRSESYVAHNFFLQPLGNYRTQIVEDSTNTIYNNGKTTVTSTST